MWPDTPTTTDCLGFCAYVDTLAEIAAKPGITPVTIGVFGDWGSGKTSLMRMLQDRLTDPSGGTLTVWFNPWQFEDKEAVQTALIHTILDELEEQKSLGAEAKDLVGKLVSGASVLKLAKVITKTALTLSPDVGGLLECFSDPNSRPATAMREFHERFEQLLALVEIQRLVVFVDDLDRCHAERALELFEATQLFLSSERCVFVIGADRDRLSSAVRQRYPDEAGPTKVANDYFEKVIQVPFHIPPQALADIDVYVHYLVMAPHAPQESADSLRQVLFEARRKGDDVAQAASGWLTENQHELDADMATVQLELQAVAPHLSTIAAGLKGIPRRIKRFLNILALRRTLADKNGLTIDGAVLVKLLALEYTWPEVFGEVVRSFDRESGHSLLLDALYATYADEKEPKELEEGGSELVQRLVPTPGLKQFLLVDPDVSSENLSPYLFLAQTSIAVTAPEPVASASALVEEIVDGITSSDALRVRSAVLRAKELDPASVQIAVERCVPFAFDADMRKATQVVKGIDGLSMLVPAALAPILDALDRTEVLKGGPLIAAIALLEKQARIHDSGPLAERVKAVQEKYSEHAPKALKPLVQTDAPRKKGKTTGG